MHIGMRQHHHSRKTPPALKHIIPLIFSLALWVIAFPANAQGDPGNATGSIQFTLETFPANSPSTFTIRLANPTLGMSIPDFSIQHGQTIQFSDVQAIEYYITIVSPSGWVIKQLYCDDGKVNTSNPGVPINVKDGLTTVCTYTVQPVPGHLSTTVYHDVNGNGIRDTGEAGLSLWAISATGGPSNVTVNGTTNSSGVVTFMNLLPGTYNVCETLQTGWQHSNPTTPCTTAQVVSSQTAQVTFGNYRTISLTIRKETTPNGHQQSFTFGGDLPIGSLADGQQYVNTTLRPGVYNVFETNLPAFWAFTSATCTGNAVATQPITNGLTITVRSGETVTCQFNNTYTPPPMGTITIRKETTPDGAAQVFNFTGDLGNFPLSDSQSFQVPGLLLRDYTIRETLPAFWTFNRVECTGGTYTPLVGEAGVTVSLQANNNVICTFYNDQVPTGSVIANKYHDLNGNGVNDSEPALSGWTMTVSQNGQTIASGTTNENGRVRFDNLFPGDYTVCETPMAGWQNSDPVDGSLCKTLTLHSAEVVRVWFGNYRNGQIIVRKVTIPDTLTNSFQFSTSFGESFSLSNGMFHQSAPLRPGVYSVTEINGEPDWVITSSCDNGNLTNAITLVSGSQVTCTFINTDVSAGMSLDLTANPTEVVAPGADVTYAVLIRNTSRSQSITVNELMDDRFGNLSGRGTCVIPQTIVAGGNYSCTYSGAVSGTAGDIFTNIVTAKGNTGTNPNLQASDNAAVRIIDTPCTGNLRRDLVGTLYDPINNTISGIITNTSAQQCEYLIGIASYRKFDEIIDNQELFDYDNPTITLGPWESYTLTIDVPSCASQVDLFYGPYLPSLNGVRYGSRLLHWVHFGGQNYCIRDVVPRGERLIPLPIPVPPIAPETGTQDNGGAFRK